jgi:hypothetical protein
MFSGQALKITRVTCMTPDMYHHWKNPAQTLNGKVGGLQAWDGFIRALTRPNPVVETKFP